MSELYSKRRCIAALCAAALMMDACHKNPPTAAAEKANATVAVAGTDKQGAGESGPAQGVVLNPEQIGKLGVKVTAVAAIDYRAETTGYGVVVPHDALAQAVAELSTAEATARQSGAALARTQRLAGTPGALSADVQESAVRQAAVDRAALTLTNQRLASLVGMHPPWKSVDHFKVLGELASGQIKLLRVTFPLGALQGVPPDLRATHISGNHSETGWKLNTVWEAPADANVPGRSFFALLKSSDAGEGERLMVFAPVGEASKGVIVPTAAVILSESRYWCYLEEDAGHFLRTSIDTERPTAEGYFVSSGIEPGDKVVTASAGLLLAQETNSGADAD